MRVFNSKSRFLLKWSGFIAFFGIIVGCGFEGREGPFDRSQKWDRVVRKESWDFSHLGGGWWGGGLGELGAVWVS